MYGYTEAQLGTALFTDNSGVVINNPPVEVSVGFRFLETSPLRVRYRESKGDVRVRGRDAEGRISSASADEGTGYVKLCLCFTLTTTHFPKCSVRSATPGTPCKALLGIVWIISLIKLESSRAEILHQNSTSGTVLLLFASAVVCPLSVPGGLSLSANPQTQTISNESITESNRNKTQTLASPLLPRASPKRIV